MMGVKAVPPMPPRLVMVKPAPCMSAPGSLPARAFSDSRRQRTRDLEDVLAVGFLDDGHEQAIRRVRREPDVEVLLEDQVLAGFVERAVEHREFAHGAQRRLHDERQRRDLHALRRGLLLERAAQRLEIGDVALVVLRDVRDVDPRGLQARPRDLLHARERLDLDRAERGVVDHGDFRQRRARGDAVRRRTSRSLTNALTSSSRMRPFSPLPRTLPRLTPSSRANLRTEGDACAAPKAASSIGGRPPRAADVMTCCTACGAVARCTRLPVWPAC